MMSRTHFTLVVVAMLASSATAPAGDTIVETFDEGSNQGGWSWGTGNQTIAPELGNPGAFLQDLTVSSCCPVLFTSPGLSSPFTGDYRQRGVVSVAVDIITLDASFGVGNRPLTLILVNDNDTPNDFDDDIGVIFVGDKNIPDPGTPGLTPAGWHDYVFAIPSQATTTPAGWYPFRFDGSFGGDDEWNAVMTEVDVVEFHYAIPGVIYPFLSWDLGLDNPRITTGSLVPGACCFVDGTCTMLTEPDCVTSGGVYQGEAVPCEPSVCEPSGVVGGCCDPATGACVVTSEALCVAAGLSYLGDETSCDGDVCVATPDPCGQPDAGNCCGSNLSPGCDDFECCDLVCSIAPYCCDVGWIGACADLAFELCETCGPARRTLLIKPGACPAPVNLSSFGFVQTVLTGDDDFDVADVVQGSLVLRRCDGAGGSASPVAELTQVVDMNHPVEGVVGCSDCACGDNQSADGIDDLVLKFATSSLLSMLTPRDGQVTLQLSGQMTDGTEFIARDCVRVVPPTHVVQPNVAVESTARGTLIEAWPPDRNHDAGGFANLGLAYTPNSIVEFTAPATWDGVAFAHWEVDGVAQPPAGRTITVTVANGTVVRAVFRPRFIRLDGEDPDKGR